MIAGKKYTVTNLQILCEFLQGWFENAFATDGKDCIAPVGLRKCADCSCNVLAWDQLCDRQYNLLVRGQTKPPAYIRFVDTDRSNRIRIHADAGNMVYVWMVGLLLCCQVILLIERNQTIRYVGQPFLNIII